MPRNDKKYFAMTELCFVVKLNIKNPRKDSLWKTIEVILRYFVARFELGLERSFQLVLEYLG